MRVKDLLDDLSIDLGLVEDRAGRYPRDLARSRQKAYLKASWRSLSFTFVPALAAVGLTVFLPSWARGFVGGAWLATVAWSAVFVVRQRSGAWTISMGAQAEQWTAQELRRLRKRGWRLLSHIMPSYGDVDHIAVGPGGLIVVETKWVGNPSQADDEEWRRGVCEGVRRHAREVRLSLKARLGESPVHTVLVYWCPSAPTGRQGACVEMTGVTVLPGAAFRGWLDSTGMECDRSMSDDAVCSSWETLKMFAEKTDQRELGRRGLVRRTPTRHLTDAAIGVVAGLSSVLASVVALGRLGVGGLALVCVLAGVGTVLYRRARGAAHVSARMIALGVVVGTSAFLLGAAGLYADVALVHH